MSFSDDLSTLNGLENLLEVKLKRSDYWIKEYQSKIRSYTKRLDGENSNREIILNALEFVHKTIEGIQLIPEKETEECLKKE